MEHREQRRGAEMARAEPQPAAARADNFHVRAPEAPREPAYQHAVFLYRGEPGALARNRSVVSPRTRADLQDVAATIGAGQLPGQFALHERAAPSGPEHSFR